jgi:hypothetical protein
MSSSLQFSVFISAGDAHFYHQQQPVGEKSDGKKPRPLIMSKRNARERRRVKMINLGYETLRLHVPGGAENKKLRFAHSLVTAEEYRNDHL